MLICFGLSAEEPPSLRALDARAANDAIDSIGYYERTERLYIPFHHKIFGRFFVFHGYTYDTISEHNEKLECKQNRKQIGTSGTPLPAE